MKKEERIVEILNEVSEKYIEEAAPAPALKKVVSYSLKRWTALAATLVCVAGISWYSFEYFGNKDIVPYGTEPVQETLDSMTESTGTSQENIASENTEPEMPSVETIDSEIPSEETTNSEPVQYHEDGRPLLTAGINVGGMGFEGLLFYDISESGNANPWTKSAELETLPVYKNMAYVNELGLSVWFDEEALLQKAKEAAEGIGVEIISIDYNRVKEAYANVPEEIAEIQDKVYMLTAITENGSIRIMGNGNISIFLEEAIELPEKYSFTWENTSDTEAEETIQYLLKQYMNLKSFKSPIVDSWGDYSYFGSQHRNYYAFEGNGTLEEQIVNYNFDKIEFSPNGEGKLWVIGYGKDCAEKIDDYPIISWEMAQELLLRGDYITTVPKEYLEDDIVKKEFIAKVELVYRTASYDEVYMPYYRFYVELTERKASNVAEGLKSFGAFYVPAVCGEYLVNFPVWEGQFN